MLYRADQVDVLRPVLAGRFNALSNPMLAAVEFLTNLNELPAISGDYQLLGETRGRWRGLEDE